MSARGQVYVLFAFLLFAFLCLAALAIDIGYYRAQQRLQQTATDSAALAGAAAAAYPSPNAVQAALLDAATNGFSTPSATVSIDPGYSDAYTTGSTAAVKVSITQSYGPFFGGIVSGNQVPISTSAVAKLSATGNGCLFSLATPPASTTLNGSKIDGPNCGIVADGNLTFNGGSTNVASIQYSNQSTETSNGGPNQFTQASPVPSLPIPDPCSSVPGCFALSQASAAALNMTGLNASAGCTTTQTVPASGGTATPGCYNGGTSGVTFDSVTFQPGLYTIVGSGGVHLTGTSSGTATFYINAGPLDVSTKAATLNLSASSSGSYAGVLFYQPAYNSNAVDIAATVNTVGMWYLPTAPVTFDGHSESFTGQVIAANFTFNGGSSITLAPGTGNAAAGVVLQATLAE
jgi:hypothetical protein